MVVHDLDALGATSCPAKTDSKLVIDADTPLPVAIASELFQPVMRRHTQIVDSADQVQLLKLSARHSLDIPEPGHSPTIEQGLGIHAAKAQNHGSY
ncbi:MAG: hypothetical protein A3F77_13480 [Betaproteobacteria bacterium RIFCSPLOWO2_12_FULL_67_28]|nr:MAG: hypothetical protein A3F77_13480 [Betaproteobacteria bacterium RIFCSPLOWO2_12_FULL_67_28]